MTQPDLRNVAAWNAWRVNNPDIVPYLRCADLRGADLRGADLCGADLRGAYLCDADLRAIVPNTTSHDLAAEILRQAANSGKARLEVVDLILANRDKCWKEFLQMKHRRKTWALKTLALAGWTQATEYLLSEL